MRSAPARRKVPERNMLRPFGLAVAGMVGFITLQYWLLRSPHGNAARVEPKQHGFTRSAGTTPRVVRWIGLALVCLAVLITAGVLAYRDSRIRQQVELATGGRIERAVPVMLANGCGGCHTIPGVPGAQGLVGPRLDGTLSQRLYIAGVVPNTSENMIRFLRSAREMVPHTAMPSTGISEEEARDIAAYLYASLGPSEVEQTLVWYVPHRWTCIGLLS